MTQSHIFPLIIDFNILIYFPVRQIPDNNFAKIRPSFAATLNLIEGQNNENVSSLFFHIDK
jgi:hypothetical protein